MTSSFKYEAALRITHPKIDPDEITKRLKINPTLSHRAGDSRCTPKGSPLPGLNKEMFWMHVIEENASNHSNSLLSLLADMNQRIVFAQAYLREIEETGGRIEYFVGWFSGLNSGEIFNWRFLEECAALRISLSFDVYGAETGVRFTF